MQNQKKELPKYIPPTKEEFRTLLRRWGGLTRTDVAIQLASTQKLIGKMSGGIVPVPYAILFTLSFKNQGTIVTPQNWRAELNMCK